MSQDSESSPKQAGTRPDRFQALPVLTVGAGHCLHDVYLAFFSPLLPVFIENLGLSKTQAGLLAIFRQGPHLLEPLIGRVADRVDLRYLVIVAPIVTAAIMSVTPLAPSYVALALLLLASGISSSCFHAVAPVMAANLSGRQIGQGMSIWMLGGTLGFTIGPIVIVTAINTLGLEGTPWLMCGGVLSSALLWWRLRGVPARAQRTMDLPPWREALHSMAPLMIPLAAIILLRSFLVAALSTYLPTFLREEGIDLWLAGLSVSIYHGAGAVGALLGGAMSDRIGRRTVLSFSLLTTPLLMLAFLTLGDSARFILLLAIGVTMAGFSPVSFAMVHESCAENRALASGVFTSLSFVLNSIVVVVVGAIADRWGLHQAFAAGAMISLLAVPIAFLLPRKAHTR